MGQEGRPPFRFETWWLQVEGFREVVTNSWRVPTPYVSGAKRIACKLRRLKVALKIWSRMAKSQRSKDKNAISSEIAALDALDECGLLEEEDRVKRTGLKLSMLKILSMEEEEWRIRSRALWLKEGDNNTRFFHKLANQRRRTNRIVAIKSRGVQLVEQQDIQQCFVTHFSSAYKARRGRRPPWEDEGLRRVPIGDAAILESPFTEAEIRRAVFSTEGDKAPGPDGFSSRFFQEFWDIVKDDIVSMFSEFYEGSQGVGCLNATFLALIPKKVGAEEISDFRPISLINACFKFLSKALGGRCKMASLQSRNVFRGSIILERRV
ncbi:hypothetical protein QJS10_CPB22g00667 [Acorus calamus]|uniref:Reverse transcriptase n=1 Tax=Acorus calamus TaxID=4465 RepID=A0AAV9C1T4_ACOCL|nr:hypothetical protein QJS10_CPB22g00667 [Acorus calamus]